MCSKVGKVVKFLSVHGSKVCVAISLRKMITLSQNYKKNLVVKNCKLLKKSKEITSFFINSDTS